MHKRHAVAALALMLIAAPVGVARLEHSTTVASFLVRDQTINPWK